MSRFMGLFFVALIFGCGQQDPLESTGDLPEPVHDPLTQVAVSFITTEPYDLLELTDENLGGFWTQTDVFRSYFDPGWIGGGGSLL